MAEETSLEAKVAELSKQLSEQAKFTRTVVLLCTGSILAVSLWATTQLVAMLPAMVYAQFLTEMKTFVYQMKACESTMCTKAPSPGATSK